MADKLLSLRDVCAVLGLHENTVYKLLQTGQLRGMKLGKLWRISEEALREYLAALPRINK